MLEERDVMTAVPNAPDGKYETCISRFKVLMKSYNSQIFGEWEKNDATTLDTSRIFINGKPLSIYSKDATMEDDVVYQLLGEAIAADARITFLKRDPETGRTTNEAIVGIFEVGENEKELLKNNPVKTNLGNLLKKKQSVDDIRAQEEKYLSGLQSAEKIIYASEYQKIIDIVHEHNQKVQQLGASIYGEENVHKKVRGNSFTPTCTKLSENDNGFRFTRSGVTLAVAYLLANGMSFEDILNPETGLDKKKAAGNAVRAMAKEGIDGRRKMALMIADAMKILSKRERPTMPSDVFKGLEKYENLMADTFMFDMNQEVGKGVLDLEEAYVHKYTQENSEGLKEDQIKEKARAEYEHVLTYDAATSNARALTNTIMKPVSLTDPSSWTIGFMASIQFIQHNPELIYASKEEKFENMEKNMTFPYSAALNRRAVYYSKMSEACGKTADELFMRTGFLNDSKIDLLTKFQEEVQAEFKGIIQGVDRIIEDVDPAYLRSSKEFREMKAVIKDTLRLVNSLEKRPTRSYDLLLEKKLQDLSSCTADYLKLKANINPKEGSNAQKRLDAVKKVDGIIKKMHKGLQAANAKRTDNVIEKQKIEVQKNLDAVNHFIEVQRELGFLRKKEPKEVGPEASFLDRCLAVKDAKNDYKIPEGLNITEAESSLLAMLAVGTLEIGKHYGNYMGITDEHKMWQAVSVLTEDIAIEREGFDSTIDSPKKVNEKMFLLEKGRAAVKECMEAYKQGDKKPLVKLLAEGIKNFTATFASFNSLTRMEVVHTCDIKVAADIYDMLSHNEDLVNLMADKSMGENRLTKQKLETYRSARVSYDILMNGLEAKKTLMDTNFTDMKNVDMKKVKEALADLIIKEIFTQETAVSGNKENENVKKKEEKINNEIHKKFTKRGIGDEDDEYISHVLGEKAVLLGKREMGKNLRKLTSESHKSLREKITNSKIVDKLAKGMNAGKISVLMEDERHIMGDIVLRIKEEESSLLKSKGVNLQEFVHEKDVVRRSEETLAI